MTGAVCATALVCLLFALTAPRLGKLLPPATATRLLVPAAVAVAASTLFVLGELGFTWLGQVPAIAALGPWSPKRLDALDPVPDPLAAASLVLLAAAVAHASLTVVRRLRALAAVYRITRGPRTADPVIIVDNAWPDAFTTPAPAARIVITTGLLTALTPQERQVVLAHEHSHLNHRHIWWILAAELAAGVNPLLRRTAKAAGQAVERWADEDAARSVGDRPLVARTIARAALLQHHAPHPGAGAAPVAAATGSDVPARVHALLGRPPRRRPLALTTLAALLVASTVATVAVERTGEHLFDRAAQPPPATVRDHVHMHARVPAPHHAHTPAPGRVTRHLHSSLMPALARDRADRDTGGDRLSG
ncbi:M48 family metalloprotease [Streptomyces sp. NPDC008139]|uniref:M56 family metallopeptidase n=1 Tax=Streptomyces sp. NPDC008139 TaxID=3364814 RepID=UPI0036ED13F1